jgi:hypothetical protein
LGGKPEILSVALKSGSRTKRTVLIAAASIVAVGVVAILVVWRTIGFGDLGGDGLGSLHSLILRSLPSDAKVTKISTSDAHWVSHGCDGSYGWSPIIVDVYFTSDEPPNEVLAHANTIFTNGGWSRWHQPAGFFTGVAAGVGWTKPPLDRTTASMVDGPDSRPGKWLVDATVPPQGKAVQTC